jgi:uncharacterized protein (DUF427 family)
MATSPTRSVKIPGPDHPISITPTSGTVTVTLNGKVIATSTNALTLQEASYPPAQYIPREDVDMSQFTATDHATYCPYKGECSYFSIPAGGARTVNAIWSYQTPYAAVAAIKDHLAFYPDRVDAIKIG